MLFLEIFSGKMTSSINPYFSLFHSVLRTLTEYLKCKKKVIKLNKYYSSIH
ncbi:hypothetical protein O3M35_007312 [Rhynocoris fuscipes]|uniref:Uncharacterized protein n=1 Tax=Rhynocoris fuscipes TaxID=488301 RepID=A0AAW1DCL4_9HEMI